MPRVVFIALLAFLALSSAPAQPAQTGDGEAVAAYTLGTEDTVRISVFGEPELAVEQRLDEEGRIRLPLLGQFRLSGMTAREAEQALEEAFVRERYLRDPQVTVVISGFRPRIALVLGQVRSPGNVSFPPNTERLEIVQFITLAGGFTETARTGNVSILRRDADGDEQTFTVDVGAMLERNRSGTRPEPFYILPGDRVSVAQRIF